MGVLPRLEAKEVFNRAWYFTKSWSLGWMVMEGELVMELDSGGKGVYVIETLRALRHMGRVEWVTCQVPESHSVVGGVKFVVVVLGGVVEVDGARRVMVDGVVILIWSGWRD